VEDGVERRREARAGRGLRVGIGRAETGIYVIIAVFLGIAAIFTLVGTIKDVIEGASSRAITDTGVFILDRVLLMFIFAELLYTLRLVSLRGRVLVEPFLFIGLIAVVRRILVVTAESELRPGEVTDFLKEIVLVLALSIHLLRRSASNQP
jgi:uncharacterized membrane protein (DUF373 family)